MSNLSQLTASDDCGARRHKKRRNDEPPPAEEGGDPSDGPQLLEVDVSHTAVSDLGPLTECRRLESLAAEGCSKIVELPPLLLACDWLSKLNLGHCTALTSLAGLLGDNNGGGLTVGHPAAAAAGGLTALILRRCLSLSNIDAIGLQRGFGRLRELDLSYCKEIMGLGPLRSAACLATLERLDLSGWRCGFERRDGSVFALVFLPSCPNLKSLTLNGLSMVDELVQFEARCVEAAAGVASESLDGGGAILRGLRGCTRLQELFMGRLVVVGPGHPHEGMPGVAATLPAAWMGLRVGDGRGRGKAAEATAKYWSWGAE